MKETLKKDPIVLYDSSRDIPYSEYVEWCKLNGEISHDSSSSEYWNWVSETIDRDWRDMLDNLSCSKADYPLLVTGTLGLWNGAREIVPQVVVSDMYGKEFSGGRTGYFVPSIRKAVETFGWGRDTASVLICFEDGVITIYSRHHDGCNTFTVHRLSQKGIASALSARDRNVEMNPMKRWFRKIKEKDIF